MPTPPRIVADGLWRCLCPSIDVAFSAKPVSTPFHPTRQATGRKNALRGHRPSHRGYQVRAAYTKNRPQSQDTPLGKAAPSAPEDHTPPLVTEETMRRSITSAIYETLKALRRYDGRGATARELVRHLVHDRGERPNIFQADALVAANWGVGGSAVELSVIIDEMLRLGIEPTRQFCHTALRALAIHPNYIMRNEILGYMKKGGVELSESGRCSVALGMLRDRQFEMAMDYMDQMIRDKLEIPAWVFDIFIYQLGEMNFIDEAFHLAWHRAQITKHDDTPKSLSIWNFLLEECGKVLHYEGTKFVWNYMVESGNLNPCDGTATNVLYTAARKGDPDLANQAIQVLSARGVKLGIHHYEALVETYTRCEDLQNALQVLCIMASTGIQPEAASTRSLFALLKRSRDLTDSCLNLLTELAKNEVVPTASVNVVIEALCAHDDLPKALSIYYGIDALCIAGPNTRTFEILLAAATTNHDAALIFSEAKLLSIKPSETMYESMVRCCATDGSLKEAFAHMSMIDRAATSPWLSKRTLTALIERSFREQDPQAWDLIDEAKKRYADVNWEFEAMLLEMLKTEVSKKRPFPVPKPRADEPEADAWKAVQDSLLEKRADKTISPYEPKF
ncbi:hypothetical protein B0T25DRAFT_543447 [Lasiosphaeria hispida]|uniref:Pentatricopeptide repeat-containing protein-mitochondrial domain-containing protein n=1 Tax=Lasiosphaeria hispida TaxID=260671 RepID=A0AAJ0HI42_9PEZI|nr:hypothetical protein B0T25DRAFT_543447 [Lasiosphaeria hispida]